PRLQCLPPALDSLVRYGKVCGFCLAWLNIDRYFCRTNTTVGGKECKFRVRGKKLLHIDLISPAARRRPYRRYDFKVPHPARLNTPANAGRRSASQRQKP